MSYTPGQAKVSTDNSSTATLAAGATFTGTAELAFPYSSLVVAVLTDQDGTLSVQFSPDGTNWDSTLSYTVSANANEIHRITVTRQYARVLFNNSSASSQTFFRLQTMFGDQTQISSAVNSVIQQDADSVVVRPLDTELEIAAGKYSGYSVVNKFGRNPDIDTASVPEDIWNGGGAYTGFPTAAPQAFQAVSTSPSDTGVLTITYLGSSGATGYSTASVTLNGTTPVSIGVTGHRVHTAQYAAGGATAFNVGQIDIRWTGATSTVFLSVPPDVSQSTMSGYTVPAGSTAYIRRFFCRVYGGSTVEGGIWVRTLGGSPRLRRRFTAGTSDHFEEFPYGGLVVPAGSDIIVRITSCATNNTTVVGGYDLVLIKN